MCITPIGSRTVVTAQNLTFLLTVVCHIWDLEAFPTVSLVGPKLYPQSLGAGSEGDGTFVCLTSLVGCHRVGERCEMRI